MHLTRAVFGAAACSVARLDAEAGELVFEAVAGEGEDTLVGRRIPAGTGLAGWTLVSQQPIAVSDVTKDPRFARDVAESTGFVPERLTVFPLLYEEDILGVLSVLDSHAGPSGGLADMDALAAIAAHAAAILAQLIAARDEPSGPGEDATTLAALRHTLVGLDVRAREAAEAVLTALEDLLRRY